MGATVTMDMTDWQKLVDAKAAAEKQVAQLQEDLAAARTEAVTKELGEAIASALHYSKELVDFAVANLHPENIRDWPHVTLVAYARMVELTADSERDRERVVVWRDHARMCEEWRQKRAARDAVSAADAVKADLLRELDADASGE